MIETFKVFNTYDKQVTPHLPLNKTATRGHSFKLEKLRFKRNTRKNCFTMRIVNSWNALPSYVVNAKTKIQFEKMLDYAWNTAEIKYNHRAPPPGHDQNTTLKTVHTSRDML